MMHIHKSSNIQPHFYSLCGTILKTVNKEKYLGVNLQEDMKWSTHTDELTATASRKLGFLKRNLRGAPANCKRLAYISLIRSGMEYASSIWDPHVKRNVDQLEGMQRRAVRWIVSKYSRTTSVTQLLKDLKLEPLEERRKALRLTLLYKIVHGKVSIKIDEVDLIYTERPARGKDANTKKFRTIRARSDEYKYSFIVRTIPEWNQIPNSVVHASSEALFKSQLLSPSP